MNLAKKLKSPVMLAVAGRLSDGSQLPKKDIDMTVEKKIGDDTKHSDKKNVHKALKHLQNMTNDQLEALLSSKDNFIIDCILDQVPVVSINVCTCSLFDIRISY